MLLRNASLAVLDCLRRRGGMVVVVEVVVITERWPALSCRGRGGLLSGPPSHSPSPNLRPAKTSRPHPSGKGGVLWLRLRVELAGMLVVEPTSLNRGEGLAICLLCVVEREVGC